MTFDRSRLGPLTFSCTLVHLIRDGQVLLGKKRRGFGKGNVVGIGGKVQAGESVGDAAIRELEEEIGVKALSMQNMGEIHFYFPHVADHSWNQRVHIFTCRKWEGEPQESPEMAPAWYPIDDLPFDKMWDDDRYWLSDMLEGKKIHKSFVFDEKLKVARWFKTL